MEIKTTKLKYRGIMNIASGAIDITDPGYDDDTWCRMNNVKIKPGNFVMSINGQFKYGNIDPEQNSELQGYQFKQQLNDRGHLYLEFYKNDSIKQIEVQLDLANNKFSVELSKQQTNISSENTEQFVQNLQEVRENPIIKDKEVITKEEKRTIEKYILKFYFY